MAEAKTKKPAAPAASNGGDDQSMEEILQSIRKIIAEENDDPAPAVVDDVEEEDEIVMATPAVAMAIPESDVLELTDMVQDDGSVANLAEDDVLSTIDQAINAPDPKPVPVAAAPAPAPTPAPIPRPAPVADSSGIVSAASIAASAAALQALRAPTGMGDLPFMSGNTVEGLVQQLLRPLLKEWLDANLPAIVQQAVEREVRRISSNQ